MSSDNVTKSVEDLSSNVKKLQGDMSGVVNAVKKHGRTAALLAGGGVAGIYGLSKLMEVPERYQQYKYHQANRRLAETQLKKQGNDMNNETTNLIKAAGIRNFFKNIGATVEHGKGTSKNIEALTGNLKDTAGSVKDVASDVKEALRSGKKALPYIGAGAGVVGGTYVGSKVLSAPEAIQRYRYYKSQRRLADAEREKLEKSGEWDERHTDMALAGAAGLGAGVGGYHAGKQMQRFLPAAMAVGGAAGVGKLLHDKLKHKREKQEFLKRMVYGDPESSGEEKTGADLTTAARNKLPTGVFALPEQRKYPIHDKAHARNALARVSQHGTPDEQEKVRRAVHNRYPDIGQEKTAKEYIPGGKAEGIPNEKFNQEDLRKGRKIEMEHTKDPKVADEIAKDHIIEVGKLDPKGTFSSPYYDEMKNFEKAVEKKASLKQLWLESIY